MTSLVDQQEANNSQKINSKKFVKTGTKRKFLSETRKWN